MFLVLSLQILEPRFKPIQIQQPDQPVQPQPPNSVTSTAAFGFESTNSSSQKQILKLRTNQHQGFANNKVTASAADYQSNAAWIFDENQRIFPQNQQEHDMSAEEFVEERLLEDFLNSASNDSTVLESTECQELQINVQQFSTFNLADNKSLIPTTVSLGSL